MLKKIRHFFASHKLLSLVILSLIVYVGFRAIRLYSAADWILSVAASICTVRIMWDVYQEYRIRRLSPDAMSIISTILALYLHMPLVAILTISAALLRKIFAEYAQSLAKKGIDGATGESSKMLTLLRGRKELEIPLSEVQPGHKLLISAGQIIPIDGVDGDGNILISGLVAEKDLVLKATATAENSQHHQLSRILKSSVRSDSPFTLLSEKYVSAFLTVSLILAGAIWYLSGDADRALAILAVAAPSQFILGAPLALLSGLSREANLGILFRSSKALEAIATARTFVSNKTHKLSIAGADTLQTSKQMPVGEKAVFIEKISNKPVVFVGDTGHDAPAMTAADVGISLGEHIAEAHAADVFILADKPSLVGKSVRIARHTLSIAALSVLIGIVLSIAFQSLAAVGVLIPLASAGLQVLVDIAVIFVALRAGAKN